MKPESKQRKPDTKPVMKYPEQANPQRQKQIIGCRKFRRTERKMDVNGYKVPLGNDGNVLEVVTKPQKAVHTLNPTELYLCCLIRQDFSV